jgi:hypothetical protein
MPLAAMGPGAQRQVREAIPIRARDGGSRTGRARRSARGRTMRDGGGNWHQTEEPYDRAVREAQSRTMAARVQYTKKQLQREAMAEGPVGQALDTFGAAANEASHVSKEIVKGFGRHTGYTNSKGKSIGVSPTPNKQMFSGYKKGVPAGNAWRRADAQSNRGLSIIDQVTGTGRRLPRGHVPTNGLPAVQRNDVLDDVLGTRPRAQQAQGVAAVMTPSKPKFSGNAKFSGNGRKDNGRRMVSSNGKAPAPRAKMSLDAQLARKMGL